MLNKHDFKAALIKAEAYDATIVDVFGDEFYQIIQTALRIADRLQSGAVSWDMIFAAKNLRNEIQDENPCDELR